MMRRAQISALRRFGSRLGGSSFVLGTTTQKLQCSTTSATDGEYLAEKLRTLEEQLNAIRTQVKSGDSSCCIASETSDNDAGKSKKQNVPQRILRSVVKIYATVSPPNSLIPWQHKLQNQVTGSGFVVDRKRRLLMTNAHVVSFASFVEVRKHGDSNRYTGYVVYIGADCDLALVHVVDPNFWADDSMSPLEFHDNENVALLGAEGSGEKEKNGAVTGEEKKKTEEQQNLTIDSLVNYEPFQGLPALQEDVKVVGYPMGGDQISITSGVVSRIDVTSYGGIGTNLLTIQLDAAINSGNSGGPALSNNKVIGIAFQSLLNADSIGYIIPNPVVSVFFRSFVKSACEKLLLQSASGKPEDNHAAIAHRSYHCGFCSLGIFYQEMQNPGLRASVNLPEDKTGVMVRDITPLGAAAGALEIGDVILKVEGTPLANDATMEWRSRERLKFSHLVRHRLETEPVTVTVWRNGEEQDVTMSSKLEKLLVPNHPFSDEFAEQPKYEIFGGFVFSTVTMSLLLEWGANDWYNNAPRWLTELMTTGKKTEDREEAILVVQKLPHDVNKGYNSMGNRIVTHLDGVPLRSLEHMQGLIDEAVAKYTKQVEEAKANGSEQAVPQPMLRFSVTHGYATDLLVLPLADAIRADMHLQAAYNIPQRRHQLLREQRNEQQVLQQQAAAAAGGQQ